MPGTGYARQPILERNRSLREKEKSYKNALSKHLLKIYPLGIPKTSSDLSFSTLSQSSSDPSFRGSLRQWDRRISDTIKRISLIQRKESPAPEVKKEEISGTTDDINKRCTWITKTSDQVYVSFHDQCWGVSVFEDWQMFEQLTLSGMLMDQNWTGILKKKELYREAFKGFDASTVANMEEKEILEISSNKGLMMSESRVRGIVDNAKCINKVSIRRRLWGPVKHLALLHPSANPRGKYEAPSSSTNGFIFVKIQGGFHEIRNSICDVVAVSRLLNAALVIPELQSTTSSKGISSDFKSFEYLYNEDQFIAALAKDVVVVKSLPNKFKIARRRKEIPVFKVPHSTAADFYLEVVLPVLKRHSVVELLVNDGGCLQAILPPNLEEYQRLRCRVAFHALRFRQDVQDLATKILYRLKASNRPYVAYDPGLTRDALAYFGCAELFQDVHAEIIQHRRRWMIRRGLVKGGLSVDSAKQRLDGSCPLMPEEVGILLRAFGYSSDTIIYVAGGEIFGGQRLLIPLRAMFDNVVDRTFLSTSVELRSIYGREKYTSDLNTQKVQATLETKVDNWKTSGPRPRPLPPPPARPKYPYNLEGWWGWVAEVDKEPVPKISEMRTIAHKLLWEAIDYVISVEADVFIPGFDLDGKGHPNFAGLVMGHRMYQSAASKTFRPDRKVVASFLEEIHDHLYQANRTLVTSLHRHLTKTLLEGLLESSKRSKSLSFLAHPIPECSCLRHEASEVSSQSQSPNPLNNIVPIETHYKCPAWMDNDTLRFVDKETFDELEDNDSYSEQFFEQNVYNQDVRGPESGSKEDVQIDDQDDLEGAER